ncbi:MAG TPA: hypothetical protein VFL34_19290 [Candidatus Sulfotelmatobacter sp.]|nr:hypothetical protein [Candidatus Sulfotelmatobacter sp.]
MDGRNLEPRTVLWAVAEVFWEDPAGIPYREPATMEDTSPSGACIRLKTPISIGSKLVVKWQREQFSAVARNCRSDGRDFLLGLRRDPLLLQTSLPARDVASPARAAHPQPQAPAAVPPKPRQESRQSPPPAVVPLARPAVPDRVSRASISNDLVKSAVRRADPTRRDQSQPAGAPPRRERKVMQPKGFFPNFWRKQEQPVAPKTVPPPTEASMSQSPSRPAEGLTGPQSNLLSYEDIYRAAGILSPRSGYGIHKVVDMLNSERIRNLAPEVKRASVLMALDAAGTSADDLLQDATRRQQALASYEAGQQKQLEEFEARKNQENAQIQAEMERITAHYAERIQHNHDQIAQEKETLRNWQMQKQCENQRITEVIELCAKQPAPAPAPVASAAAASASSAPAVAAPKPK